MTTERPQLVLQHNIYRIISSSYEASIFRDVFYPLPFSISLFHYGKIWDGHSSLQLLLRGVGDTYLVTSSTDRFILRAYRSSHRSLPQIKAELNLLIELKRMGVPVSFPIHDLSGECMQTLEAIEGKRQIVLFSYARGHSVSILNKSNFVISGIKWPDFTKFPRLSNSGMEMLPNFDLETTLFKPLEMLKYAYREDPEGYLWMQQAARKVERRLKQIETAVFPTGYCHFDFLTKNFHFDGDSITFFDFDFLGFGWLVNDVMTFWQQLCLDVHFGRMKQSEANDAYSIFLESYREVRPLSEMELEVVPDPSLGFWLFYMGFHTTHDQFYPFIQPDHLKLRTGLIRQLMERYWGK